MFGDDTDLIVGSNVTFMLIEEASGSYESIEWCDLRVPGSDYDCDKSLRKEREELHADLRCCVWLYPLCDLSLLESRD